MRVDLTPEQAEAILVLCETANFGRMRRPYLEALLEGREAISEAYKLYTNLHESLNDLGIFMDGIPT
jgi:hypothetical protein